MVITSAVIEKVSDVHSNYQYVVALKWRCSDGDMEWTDIDLHYFECLSDAREFVDDVLSNDVDTKPIYDLVGYCIGYIMECNIYPS